MRAMTTDTTTTAPAAAAAPSSAVDLFLAATAAGRGGDVAAAYAPDAVLDATVPGWRFAKAGPDAIAQQYAGWFADPGEYEELIRRPVDGGEVVTYLFSFAKNGVPHAARHCHVFEFAEDGRIRRDTVFCGGQWDAALLARMAAEA